MPTPVLSSYMPSGMSFEPSTRPRIVATSAGPSSKAHAHSNEARVAGSAFAGVSELLLFHPVDTTAKRLMANKGTVRGATMGQTFSNLNTVVFKDAANKSFGKKYLSLFPGLGWGGAYKILQRVYKFGGQPFVKDFFANSPKIAAFFERRFGEKHSKTMMHATAGSIIGVGEIFLLPLDVLKIKSQTNPQSIAGRGIVDIFTTEGWNLYRQEYIFKLEHYGDATWGMDFCASVVGAMGSLIVSAPLDVVKTRIQSRAFDKQQQTGMTIVRNMVAQEGFGSFFKGLTPKLIVVGPKLIFSFTVAQHMISYLDTRLMLSFILVQHMISYLDTRFTGGSAAAAARANAPTPPTFTPPKGGSSSGSSSSSSAQARRHSIKEHIFEDTVPKEEEKTVRSAGARGAAADRLPDCCSRGRRRGNCYHCNGPQLERTATTAIADKGEGGAGGNYDDPYGNDDYYNDPYGGRGPPPQPAGWDDWDEPFDQQQQPPDYWPDNRQQQQQQPPSRKKGTKRRSGGGLEVGGVDLGSVVTKGHKTWGGMCIAAGVLLTGMGISLFFNKFLIRLGNLALVLGVSLLIGPSRCVKYFTHPTKLRGTIIFALGFFLVFTGHPILGIAAEVFGFLNLFGNMLPLLTMMARQLPVVGDLIPQPGTGGGGSKRGKPKRRPPPPPPPQDDWFDGDYGDYGGDDGVQRGLLAAMPLLLQGIAPARLRSALSAALHMAYFGRVMTHMAESRGGGNMEEDVGEDPEMPFGGGGV
ncbi:mitochondrial carrier domain-containing protein [Tribonema minus]|uniref:Mitochondrial carrier domain-containing protein n=1 Tax=Tribonema minus TaxID=303371 RepID=A0A835Z8R7_9STRA|nr:mitochondrial carrier domain-containing protein [Tribonema minus]